MKYTDENNYSFENLFYDAQKDEYSKDCPYLLQGNDVKNQINRIMEARRVHITTLSDASRKLTNISRAVSVIVGKKDLYFDSEETISKYFPNNPAGAKDFGATLGSLDKLLCETIRDRCNAIQSEISKASERFSRKTLSIAVVGNSGQGKSTLIQSITGLDSRTIPSAGDGVCTAARSKIVNANTFMATISFYKENEFFKEVLTPYFVHFKVLDENEVVDNIVDAKTYFAAITREAQDMFYGRLKDYIENYSAYRDMLDAPDARLFDEDEVGKYVSMQRDNGEVVDYTFMAVKNVEIECPFPIPDVQSLSIVDTIGINEPTLNIKDRMFETISDDADFVLFVKLIDDHRGNSIDDDQLKTYYTVMSKLSMIPAEKWIYFVMNHRMPYVYNSEFEAFHGNVDALLKGVNNNALRKPGAFIELDARDRDEVNRRLVVPMLNHLSVNLNAIDTLLIKSINDKISELQVYISRMLNTALQLKLEPIQTAALKLSAFGELYPKLVAGVAAAMDAKYDLLLGDNEESEWQDAINAEVDNIETQIPDHSEYIKISAGQSALGTIESFYQATSSNLRNMFNNDKCDSREIVDKMHIGFLEVFLSVSGLDKVDYFKDLLPIRDPVLTFDLISSKLFGTQPGCSTLAAEFKKTSQLQINPGATLAAQMNGITACIDPNRGDGNIPSHWNDIGLETAIREMLLTKMDYIRAQIMEAYQRLASPESALIATYKAFITAIFGSGNNSFATWQLAMFPYIEQLVPEVFAEIGSLNVKIDEWNRAVSGLTKVGELKAIDF